MKLTAPDFPVKAWKAPRPSRTEFVPKANEPGARVEWRQLLPVDMTNLTCESCGSTGRHWNDMPSVGRTQCTRCYGSQYRQEWVTRTGQVWSKSAGTACFFVVPDVRLEDEQCVELRQGKSDREPRHVSTIVSSQARIAIGRAA